MDDLAEKLQAILSDEESLRNIKELADMMTGGGNYSAAEASAAENAAQNGSNGFDFGSLLGGLDINAITRIWGALSEVDKNSELLLALRPHLSDERKERVDKAVRMLKLYNVYSAVKENGILENLV